MKILRAIVVLVVGAMALFSLLNWQTLTSRTAVSVGFTSVQAPPGLVLLAGSALVTAALIALVVYERTAALLQARRFARELHEQRDLADKAEASRFTELRSYLESELHRLSERSAAARADGDSSLGRLEQQLMAKLSEVDNAIAAHLAEMEDKIDRVLGAKKSC